MKTNFDICCESMENMASVIDIAKYGWGKEQILEWLRKPICGIAQEDANNVGKPDWCPLKLVPEKLPEEYEDKVKDINGDWITIDSGTDSVAVGYNRCIDEILTN